MKTAVLLAIGSRGDCEPLVALGATLLDSEIVDMLHFHMVADYTNLLPADRRIVVHTHDTLTMSGFRAAMKPHLSAAALTADPVEAQRCAIAALVTDCVTPLLPELHDAVHRHHERVAERVVFVTTTLGATLAIALSRHFGLFSFVIHMQPNILTGQFPFYLAGIANAMRAATEIARLPPNDAEAPPPPQPLRADFRASYEGLIGFFTPALPAQNRVHVTLGLESLSRDDVVAMLSGDFDDVGMVLAYSKLLIPRPADVSPRLHCVGPLADDFVPRGFTPGEMCPALATELMRGSDDQREDVRPVCVSLGSMTAAPDQMRLISSAILHGLRAAGVLRVILLRGSGSAYVSVQHLDAADDALRDWCTAHVAEVRESAPFAWLLPQCAALISHGGAGSVAAALRAGIPVAVAPAMVDQYFWAELVARLRLGAFVRPALLSCSGDAVREAVATVLSEEVREKARMYARRRGEHGSGASQCAELIRTAMTEKKLLCDRDDEDADTYDHQQQQPFTPETRGDVG